MKRKRINLFNIPIDCLTMEETINIIVENINNNNKSIVNVGINSYIVNLNLKNDILKDFIKNSELINADGQSIVLASRILGNPLPERVAGIDLMENLVKIAYENSYKIFFFGAKEEIVKEVVRKYSEKYSPNIIAGYRNGYYNQDEEEKIADEISKSNANILFVAMTSPKKEIFIHKYKDKLKNINFIMGVGGSFDVVAGHVKRAPLFMQKIGMEWFYRFVQEPRRLFRRYFETNTKFLFLLFKEYIKLKLRKNKQQVFTNQN
ncbi:MAG: UDP-N-acetyl-D-mannosamine transferase [Candidatus Sericytochromatia bacterium]|nr:MAG: UDP-N-acetyl-D-mannosamine transferase [Candidatus Sericytochromatia bacterium]